MVYAAYERVGTTANADSVEHTRNLPGGFLAVGMTKNQPGFMVLSQLDQDKVEVDATQVVNHVAGTHTVVEIQTPSDAASIRLRGPQVVLVSEKGSVERYQVDWTVTEFNELREAVDCSHKAAIKKHRCGAPFTDLTGSSLVLAGGPDPALGGYCPVCLVTMDKLVKGDAKYSSTFDGQAYLFPGAEQKKMFDANPVAFAPVLGGDCTVCRVEMGKDVPGKAELAVDYDGKRYLFPGKKQLDMFVANPRKYVTE